MTHPDRIERPNVTIADARSSTPADYTRLTGRKLPTEAEKAERYERDQAWAEHERKLMASHDWKTDDRLRGEYRARLDEIDAKYGAIEPARHVLTDRIVRRAA